MNLQWQMKTPQTEKQIQSDMYTGLQYQYYSADDEVDYLSFTSSDEEIKSKLNWVAFKQQFFQLYIYCESIF